MLDSMSTAVRAVLHKKGAAAGKKVAAAEKKMLLPKTQVHEKNKKKRSFYLGLTLGFLLLL